MDTEGFWQSRPGTDDLQLGVWILREDLVERIDEHMDALVRRQAADKEDAFCARILRRRLNARKFAHRHPIVDDVASACMFRPGIPRQLREEIAAKDERIDARHPRADQLRV